MKPCVSFLENDLKILLISGRIFMFLKEQRWMIISRLCGLQPRDHCLALSQPSVWLSHGKHKDAFEEMKHDELIKKTSEQFLKAFA